jgi:undecaprenyl-diphosphatase
LLAKAPWVGYSLALLGLIIFGVLYFNVATNGPLTQWDKPLSVSMPAYSLAHASYMRPITEAGFFVGGWMLTIAGFLLFLYYSSWHHWEEFFMIFIGMVGESLLFEIINTLVARPRPPTQIWHVLNIASFPSGHSQASVVFYGLMAYLLIPKTRSVLGKVLIFLTALALILLVGFSRVATGGHYLSDVLAGYGLGLAWAGIVYTSVEAIFKHKRSRDVKQGKAHSFEIDR